MTTPPPAVNPYTSSDAAPAGRSSLARVSFVIAIVVVALAIVLQVVSSLIPVIMYNLDLGSAEVGVFFGVAGFLNLILGGFALVFGLLGARERDSALQAGIGIGVGGLAAITSLIGLIVPPLTSLLY